MVSAAAKPALFLDVTRLLLRGLRGRLPTGIDRVGLAYIEHFGQRAAAVIYVRGRMMTLSYAASQCIFDALLVRSASPARLLRSLVVALRGVRGATSLRGAVLMNTGHTGLEQHRYGKLMQHLTVKPVFMLHDLIPISHPEYCRPGEKLRHAERLATMLACGAGIVTNSQATLDELARYADANRFRLPAVVAAPLAPAVLPQADDAVPLVGPYFVAVGTIEGRKNHSMLLQVWRALVAAMGADAPALVLIGQRGWECENAIDLLERCEQLRGKVMELGRCGDRELAGYLRHAQALLFPSFAEGYGLPLMEALAANVPVIASDLPVFRELAGDVPDYLDPLDGLGWLTLIRDYCDPQALARSAQLERMAGFRAPGWPEHFAQVERLLLELQ
jgi:glycosyltransferase involved in cell wall biosynthesis